MTTMTDAKMIWRPSDQRGLTQTDWLNSRHTFSFGDYRDDRFMQFGPLRVINEDFVAPQRGFETHGHRDMEIVSLVLEGQLRHRDDMGNGSIIQAGDVQRMTAGFGVLHSEFNPLVADTVHFLQIWIVPNQKGLPPSYEQTTYAADDFVNRWRLIVSPDGREGSVTVHQDVCVYKTTLDAGKTLEYILPASRMAWVQGVCGDVHVNQNDNAQSLQAGDGLGVRQAGTMRFQAQTPTEIVLFEMAIG